ncbi:hypothetical protein Vretimale_16577 [Volvox reticuliferus]|uniref:Uncharacterized protein n=1 Tax=Volvox reticuliferus TaxID=1737510 RepID=A0A8J4GT79_9CHLO|nr:hypothetical protein Vretifemale_17548 [Volvox reticuliferus]GIM13467.1 hypothetical protein Vretimale_16577 [Volvox reticuliferus]
MGRSPYGDDDGPGPSPYSDNYLATFAAITIQRWWRGYRVRKEYLAKRARIRKVEMDWATHHDVIYRTNMAARVIQTAWRSYRNRRIFTYYRDLIRFRERGDPRELLRVINPREAQLVDAAAGIHVRFRLGGTVFPPLVFYKIFTHRPVADICAFGPRDYANEVRATPTDLHNNRPAAPGTGLAAAPPGPILGLPPAAPASGLRRGANGAVIGGSSAADGGKRVKKKHVFQEEEFELDNSYREYIKPDGTIGYRSTKGWYERHENNGWRPVSERVLLDEDPVTTMTRLKRQPMFHYNPAVRREQRAKLIKQRKREWLRKMYAEGTGGMRPAGSSMGDNLGPGLALGLDFNLDELEDGQLDEKVEELLNWSEHLDFGSYFDDWTSMACTLASEAFVPEDEAPYLDDLPKTRADARLALEAAGVPNVPFKGGPNAACGTAVHLN